MTAAMPSIRCVLAAAASVWLTAVSTASGQTVKGQPFPSLMDVTIDDLQTGLTSGLFTSMDLVNAYVARILEVNETLHMVTEINPDALAIAQELDAARSKGAVLGPLHGIPILIKNNIATMDKMNNTAGSWSLVGAKVGQDSGMAKKLRAAGAIILGKANLSQWANYRSSNSSNGWSAHGGQTLSAYYPNLDPSGSSSGSGVSSDLGLALASLGTETSGSIISPAARNNIVGIKPTVGLTSRFLVIPISEHQDTVGPMARTVKDAAIILTAIAGYDKNDNYTRAIPYCGKRLPNYASGLSKDGLRGARIGIPYNVVSTANTTEIRAYWAAVELMRSAGAVIVNASFANPSAPTSNLILPTDFEVNLAQYLAQLTYNPTGVQTLREVRDFTWAFPAEEWPNRDTATWDAQIARGWNNTDPRFWAAYQQNLYAGGEAGLLGAYARSGADAIVLPASASAGRAAGVGAPIITVPLGFAPEGTTVTRNSRGLVTGGPGVPFGLGFLGGLWSEHRLIKVAYAFEQMTMARKRGKGYIKPSTELGDIVGK